MFLIALMLLLQTACGSESENVLSENNYPAYANNEDIVDTDMPLDEIHAEDEVQPPTYPILEEDINLDNGTPTVAYFPRVDFDAIDFTSLIIPTDTPHGYIGHWYVRHISTYLPSRVPFTYRELDTALWIEQMLHAKGFDESQVQMQIFSHYDVSGWENYFGRETPGLSYIKQQGWHDGHIARGYSQNIILTIPGQSTQTIIIGAHYDSLRYTGTSDNASGTSLLMENAQRMLANDNYYTLVYVFFGAHEIGMLGTFYFYESLLPEDRENIVLYINADVLIEGPTLAISIGYDFQLNTNALSEHMKVIVESFSDTHGIEIATSWGITGGDQLLFLYKGYTTLAFWGVCPVNFSNFLHSPKDSYEYISSRFPGMVENAMNAFALLLETVLLEKF